MNSGSSSKTFTRRAFLRWSGSVALLSLSPAALLARSGDLETVCLIHTTDLHGNILPAYSYGGVADLGGLARCATRIKQWRSQYPHNILLDLGDLYQGTEVGYRSRGQIMIRCLNHLGYDAWVPGNHEFDWGVEAFEKAVQSSNMPVVCSNSRWDGHRVWNEREVEKTPLHPWLLKEVNGYRIAFIGLTTPGIPSWFLPEKLGQFRATDPVGALRMTMRQVEAARADAIVLGTHMGIRPGMTRDDNANRLFAIAEAFPQIDVILGGHTHRNQPNERIAGIPYSQANYFGIHVGRLDLVFDRDSRKLVHVQPMTSYMDSSVKLDPEVLSLTREEVEASSAYLAEPVGRLADRLSVETAPARPSGIERLVGTAVVQGLKGRGIHVDACYHGLIYQDSPIEAGDKTVEDCWSILPFENFVVTARFTREQLIAVMEEAYNHRSLRNLIGLPKLEVRGPRGSRRIVSVKDERGREWPNDRPITVAINSYDAASGGGRFPLLREILEGPSSQRKLHQLLVRSVMIDWIREHSPVRGGDLL